MKYIRTEKGVYERTGTKILSSQHNQLGCLHTIDWKNYKIILENILKESDKLNELCDEFVAVDSLKLLPNSTIDYDDIADDIKRCGNRFKYFGGIWIYDKDGVPTFKSVSKINDEGELELI